MIAYANFDGTGPTGTITARAQSGFSSISRTNTGRYTLTFSSTQSDTNYLIQATGGTNSTAVVNISTKSTTSFNIMTGNNVNGAVDLSEIYVRVYAHAGVGQLTGSFVTGMIMMFSGTTAPSGWAFCDGTNGTPDLRGRFIVASQDMSKTGTTSQSGPGINANNGNLLLNQTYQPGDIGGENAHQLTVDELASHNHGGGMAGGNCAPGGQSQSAPSPTGSTGGDKYHENRPPYYALAYIMKT